MAKGMDFYEMSLLQTELKLDDTHKWISALNKSKKLTDDKLLQKLGDEKELSAKAKRFKKKENSPVKYGLVPTTPDKVLKDGVTTPYNVLKDDIVKDDVVHNKMNDKDETIPDSKLDDKDEFDDYINFNKTLELCGKLTHDKNDKTDDLTHHKNEKYDNNDKDDNDVDKLINNVSDK